MITSIYDKDSEETTNRRIKDQDPASAKIKTRKLQKSAIRESLTPRKLKRIRYIPCDNMGRNSNIVHNTILNLANKQFTLVLKGLELLGHTIEIIIIACLN